MACFGIGNGGQDHQSDQPITIHIKPRKMAEAGKKSKSANGIPPRSPSL
jgi:hypothetical protein